MCQKRPSVCQKKPSVCQKRPSVCQKRPSVCQKRPSMCQKRPSMCQKGPSIYNMPHKADSTVICQCGEPTNLLTNPHTTTTFMPHKADSTVICLCGAMVCKYHTYILQRVYIATCVYIYIYILQRVCIYNHTL